MKYSISEAKEYSKRNELGKWLQLFLRDNSYKHANPNISLADGLLLEERFYVGPVLIDLDKINTFRIEKDIEDENNKLNLVDGNHRYSALKKLGFNKYYVII